MMTRLFKVLAKGAGVAAGVGVAIALPIAGVKTLSALDGQVDDFHPDPVPMAAGQVLATPSQADSIAGQLDRAMKDAEAALAKPGWGPDAHAHLVADWPALAQREHSMAELRLEAQRYPFDPNAASWDLLSSQSIVEQTEQDVADKVHQLQSDRASDVVLEDVAGVGLGVAADLGLAAAGMKVGLERQQRREGEARVSRS